MRDGDMMAGRVLSSTYPFLIKGDGVRGFLFAAVMVALVPCATATAQDDTDQKLGKVHFATSCNETAQRRFDCAMRYQHSFW